MCYAMTFVLNHQMGAGKSFSFPAIGVTLKQREAGPLGRNWAERRQK